ncbi:DUF2956 domain-containing protein [methane-oxidizing endosymbiont of Gigantopelta aegis]|uniref:DUF2956 domain-containing protein n=1 Tax=methane-oxidizing endosymbiont of Gigantopelta aegis TaxID=2794938 RepID=UPI0018DB9D1A|nr:DUF2956 domain-containing protein [methane-oxidizing endosymbiont of Gigantopelta aegis]
MKKHINTTTSSPQTQEQALKIARATQRPGQTKEQTKLIAQGIQKGIEQYKKQQKAKARELDKNLKKVRRQLQQADLTGQETSEERPADIVVKQSKLAWVLLILSWLCFAAYLFFIA